MYEKYEINKIFCDMAKEVGWLWQLLMKDYEKIILMKHKDCEHTEMEIKLLVLDNLIDDLNGSIYFSSSYFPEYVFKKIGNYAFDFIRGFSMMPDLNPADFVIYKTIEKVDDVEVGDIIEGHHRENGIGAVHKVIYKGSKYLFMQGNSNEIHEVITNETILSKIIMRIERESEFWNEVVKNSDLKKECISSINSTLENKESEDEKEVKYLKNLKKRLEIENAKE